MFLVNSRLNLFTAALSSSTGKRFHPTGALLIPKLRSDFAEFLKEGYLDHLSIFYLSTCVGFGTGTHATRLEAFPGSMGWATTP